MSPVISPQQLLVVAAYAVYAPTWHANGMCTSLLSTTALGRAAAAAKQTLLFGPT